jgi:hypothetical protein
VTVNQGSNVPLNASATDNTANAFTLNVATGTVTVIQAGLYLITYNVNIAAGSTGVFQLFQNSTALPNTIGTTQNSGAGGHMLEGFTLIRLSTNDQITIRNIGPASVLQTTVSGTTPTSAMLSILKVG